jgi:hypothetical protein
LGLKPQPLDPQLRQQRLIQLATLLAGVSLILVVVNIGLAVIDQRAQAEVNQRQQIINQAAQLNAVSGLLTRALISQAQAAKDPQIEALLKRAGAVGATPAAAKP